MVSVPMGQDCVDVRFTFSEGKPIPIDYTVQAVRVFHERARRILNIHSGNIKKTWKFVILVFKVVHLIKS